MNSMYALRKILFFDSSLRFSRLYLNKHKYRIQNFCTIANCIDQDKLNIDRDNIAENQYSKSKLNSNISSNSVESDTFGSLKIPLEDGKFIRKSQAASMKHRNKKIIKMKKPKSSESDTFGNLSESKPMWYPDMHEEPKRDNDLSDDSVIVKNLDKRSPRKYLQEMKKLVGQKKVKEALDLFVDMRRNFVAPIHPHYTYMIGVCGRIGYTEMAFNLLLQMTDRKFRPTPATLTGLFNACAESPFPEYGLKKAHYLREKIKLKNWNVSQITYHAMIKAFGKCGDLVTAFQIVDEMAKAEVKINTETYNFLLTSCISNKECGFTYAVEVWRMMKAKKCRPDIYTFNLLLRATRDCDIGPEDISCLLLQHWSSYNKRPYGFATKESLLEKHILRLNSGSTASSDEYLKTENKNNSIEADKEKSDHFSDVRDTSKCEIEKAPNSAVTAANSQISVANLLSVRPINGPEILEILNVKTSSDRLSLLGSFEGFLKIMYESKVMPETKTFSLLLHCIPDNIKEEEKLITILDKYQIKPEIEFFNILIKKRIFRRDDAAARDVLCLINKYSLTPDIMTFGTLALGCRNLKQAITFISEMEKMGSYPNIEIIGCMIKRACMILDFSYVKYALGLMEEHQIKPNERVLKMLEKYIADIKKNVILMEHGKEVHEFYKKNEDLPKKFKEFLVFYEDWLKRTKFQPEDHPWLQYKTDILDRPKEEKIDL